METLGRIRSRGDDDFTVDDFGSMPYLLAVGKVCSEVVYLLTRPDPPAQEILRINPALVEIPRSPNKDDVLPLSKPIVGVSGRVHKELPVPAGTFVVISTIGYNLCVHPLDPCPRGVESCCTGTKVYGDQTLVNSDRNDGST